MLTSKEKVIWNLELIPGITALAISFMYGSRDIYWIEEN